MRGWWLFYVGGAALSATLCGLHVGALSWGFAFLDAITTAAWLTNLTVWSQR